jgi:hypothetical protein
VRGAPTPFATRINAVLLCAEGVFLLASDAAKTALRLHVTDRTWRGSGSASGFAGIPCFDQRRGSFRIRRFMIVDGSTACAESSTSSHSPASFLQPDRSALAALLGKWVRKVNCSRALSERTPTGPRRRVAGVSHGSFPNQTAIDKHSHFLPLQRCLQGIRCAGPDDGNCHRAAWLHVAIPAIAALRARGHSALRNPIAFSFKSIRNSLSVRTANALLTRRVCQSGILH